MTTILVVLIGIGVTFIASSLDCTPIRDTFMKIVENQAVDWTGTQNCKPLSQQSIQQQMQQQYTVPPGKNNTCPQGYVYDAGTKKCWNAAQLQQQLGQSGV